MSQFAPAASAAQTPRRFATLRTVTALILREMNSTHGRSALGYLWAILEPVGGILVMTVVFSIAFNAPPIGNNFALFYASGLLPFMAYNDVSAKVSGSLRFSKSLLYYPGVTYLDAVVARLIVAVITQVMVITVVLAFLFLTFRLQAILDIPKIVNALMMAFTLGLGVGTVNCFLMSTFPMWERIWAVINRPMFIVSCVMFIFMDVPKPYRDWLWWNPLVHLVGQMRTGIYPTYDGNYISPLYVYAVALTLICVGLLLLRRYYRDIIDTI